MARRRVVAVLVLVVLVAAGVAIGSRLVGDDVSSTQADALTITVVTASGQAPRVMTLRCDPVGGDHPDASAACRALDKAGLDVFDPVPKGRMCTQLYGGPQTATVTGTYKDADVDARFSRADGCQVDRWDALGTAFFDVPML